MDCEDQLVLMNKYLSLAVEYSKNLIPFKFATEEEKQSQMKLHHQMNELRGQLGMKLLPERMLGWGNGENTCN